MCNSSSFKKPHGASCWLCFRSSKPEPFDMFSSSKKPKPCRWLSFRSSNLKSEHYDFCNSSKARSILCLHEDEIMPMVNDPKPVNFSLLIVLDLTFPLYNKGVLFSARDHQSNLVLLRYLTFEIDRSLGFEGLKNVLCKNKKLQTLIVSHSATHRWQVDSSLLPSTIWGSPDLRHLEFRNFFRVEPPSIVKEDLQVWYWLSIFHCTEEVISRIPNVKTLGIFCEDRLILDDGVSCNGISLKNLCYLNQLEVLTIEAEYAIPKRMSLPSIDALPCNLRKLKLSNTYLPWKGNIATIALLPRLEVLKLKMDAFYGPEWEPTEGGFRRLKFLLLENSKLEIWNAFDDEFPMLERLVLKYCERLEEIPSSFSTINSLQSIDLERCKPALLTCAKNIQEERLTYGYDGFALIDRTPQIGRVSKNVLVPGCSNPISIVENFEDLSKLEALSVIVPVDLESSEEEEDYYERAYIESKASGEGLEEASEEEDYDEWEATESSEEEE
nr:putative late blight resistance protein homolog R1A-4 [Ipomoea batatas]